MGDPTKVVFLGSDNTFSATFEYEGQPWVTSNITRAVVTVGNDTVDSLTEPNAVSWSITGVFSFQLGGSLTQDGLQDFTLRVYDTTAPNGVVIIHRRLPNASLKIRKITP